MELRQLRHLIAIIEHGSVSAAAKAVQLSQPALTRSMNALEQNIGEPLLLRGQGGAQPTAAGAILYEYAKSLVAGADNVRMEISRLAQGLGGVVNIGVGNHLAEFLMPRALASFATRHARISVNVITGRIEDLVAMLLAGEVEFIASMVPRDKIRRDLDYERLFVSQTYVFAGADHPLHAQPQPIPLGALSGERWASTNSSFADSQLNRLFAEAGEGLPRQLIRTNSLAMMRALIESQGFVGIMPAEYMIASSARPLNVPGLPIARGCGLIYKADQPPRAIISDMIRAIQAAAATAAVELPVLGEAIYK